MTTPTMSLVGRKFGSPQVAEEADLDDTVVSSSTFKNVWNVTGTEKVAYWVGQGIEDQESNVGRLFLDAQNSVPGAINGTARFVAYEDESMDFYKAIGPEFSLTDLRSAVSDGRTERPMLAAYNPGAGKDERIGLEVKAAAANDGDTLTAAQCDAHIPYTQLRNYRG